VAALSERRVALGTGLTYHVLEWDGGGDHTLLLIHGFLDFAWGFQPLVQAGLEGRYHIVAPDLRGHGDSDRVGPGGYYHFADYLPDLHDLIARLARGRLSIVGHSMGGTVASYYAGTFPERVERLVLLEGIGPPETPTPTGPERVAAWIRSWERSRAMGARPYASVSAAADRLREHDPLLDAELALLLAQRGTRSAAGGGVVFKHDPLHATLGPYGGFQLEVAARFWRRITCPTLHVAGGASEMRLLDDEVERRLACFPRLERRVLDGAGHMMQRHRPAELARMIDAFVSGQGPVL
jgi:pimeloyl-ACP methyl ester carboxylesterase